MDYDQTCACSWKAPVCVEKSQECPQYWGVSHGPHPNRLGLTHQQLPLLRPRSVVWNGVHLQKRKPPSAESAWLVTHTQTNTNTRIHTHTHAHRCIYSLEVSQNGGVPQVAMIIAMLKWSHDLDGVEVAPCSMYQDYAAHVKHRMRTGSNLFRVQQ